MINTVTGKIEAKNLGNILIHEHVSIVSSDFHNAFGQGWLDKDALATYAADAQLDFMASRGAFISLGGNEDDFEIMIKKNPIDVLDV